MLTLLQQGIKRRQIDLWLVNSDLVTIAGGALHRQTNVLMAKVDLPTLTAAMATGDYTALAQQLAGLLSANEGMDAHVVGSGPIITELMALLAQLLPLLVSCIQAIPPATSVTPAQVLAAIQ
jgi:hypothetical protein